VRCGNPLGHPSGGHSEKAQCPPFAGATPETGPERPAGRPSDSRGPCGTRRRGFVLRARTCRAVGAPTACRCRRAAPGEPVGAAGHHRADMSLACRSDVSAGSLTDSGPGRADRPRAATPSPCAT
jgi:hypothetical protein